MENEPSEAALSGVDPSVDPGRQRVHVELLLLLCIVEHVNVAGARAASERTTQPPLVASVLERVRVQLCRPKPGWASTDVLDGLRAVLSALVAELEPNWKLSPKQLAELTARQCSWLQSFEHRRSESRSRPQRRQVPGAMRVTTHWRDITPDEHDDDAGQGQRVLLTMTEECYDPLAVAREYMRTELHTLESTIDHDLQLFIRRVFLLKHRKHYAQLASLCVRINELFFNVASFSFRSSHDLRPPIVSTRRMLDCIREELQGQRSSDSSPEQDRAYQSRLALGFFFAFRFCELMRLVPLLPDVSLKDSHESPAEPSASLRVGVRILQPLAYTSLRAKLFGTLSGIDGWNEILGGGLLPGLELGRCWVVSGAAGSGKTSLAVHLGADMAAREHLVIYFSFEEPYLNISDRVLAFQLYQPDRFRIAAIDDTQMEERLAAAANQAPHHGLLLYYRGDVHSLSETLQRLHAAIDQHASRFRRSTAVIIDSVDALEPAAPNASDSRYDRRKLLRDLIHQLEQSQFSALLLTEAGNPELPTLQHLADTYIEVGIDDTRAHRWLQMHKSRLADFMRGKHGYRLRDGRGVALVPNLWSVQRTVRRRIPAPLSENSVIAFPEGIRNSLPVPVMQEKSSMLVWGNERSAILPFWLHLLTEPTSQVPLGSKHLLTNPDPMRREISVLNKEPLGGVLVVSFRTAQARLQQSLRLRPVLLKRWNLLPGPSLTWYQPQPGLTGARIVHNLRRVLAESRVLGRPIERIVFDEIDAIDSLLPKVADEAELWPTIFGLLACEPVSVIYVVGTGMSGADQEEPSFTRKFADVMDYCCHIWSRASSATSDNAHDDAAVSGDERTYISLYKHPVPVPSGPKHHPVAITVTPEGNFEDANHKRQRHARDDDDS